MIIVLKKTKQKDHDRSVTLVYVSVLMGRYSYIGGVVKDSGGKQKKASRKEKKDFCRSIRVHMEVKRIVCP